MLQVEVSLGCGAFRVGECRLPLRELDRYVLLGHFLRELLPLLLGQLSKRRLHGSGGLEDHCVHAARRERSRV
jgi:hypothetical protein